MERRNLGALDIDLDHVHPPDVVLGDVTIESHGGDLQGPAPGEGFTIEFSPGSSGSESAASRGPPRR